MRLLAIYDPHKLGLDGDKMDASIREIFELNKGRAIGSGYLMVTPYERDIEYDVPDVVASSCVEKLIALGCRVECP